MLISCMATKTITLEIDAYEKLETAKKAGETFLRSFAARHFRTPR
jgi:predicted CopG family antitoxin